MAQPRYILRCPFKSTIGDPMPQMDEILADFKDVYKDTEKVGPFQFRMQSGVDKSAFTIHAKGWSATVRTARELKACVRALRDQEASQLDAMDEQIAVLRAQLRDLTHNRRELLKAAFARGNVVTLQDVRLIAQERDNKRLARNRGSEVPA